MHPSVRTPDELHSMLWTFAAHRVVTVANRVGLLRRLASSPVTVDSAAMELGLSPVATGKIVRTLCAIGIAEPLADGFRIVDSLRHAFIEGDEDLSGFVEHAHVLYDRWGATLEPWLRDEPVAVPPRTPEQQKKFDHGMVANARRLAPRVIEALPREGAGKMLDIGGGLGAYAQLFCRAWDGLTATVLDQQHVVARGPEFLRGTPEAEKISFLDGDYAHPIDGSYDLVLLANVLHQERPDTAAAMVQHAASALRPSGRLVVVDFAIDDDKHSALIGCLFAINMRSFGDTHSEPQIRGWLRDAGLVDQYRVDITSSQWMIVGRRGDQTDER